MLEGIEAVRLERQQEVKCLAVMRTGNPLRDEWSVYLGQKHGRKFRDELFNYYNPKKKREQPEVYGLKPGQLPNPFGCIPAFRMNEWRRDLPLILAVRDVEWDMTCSYINLARDLANRWARMAQSNVMLTPDVFGQEAWMALRNAIYGYSKENIEFSTYATRVIRNHLLTVYTNGSPARYFSREERKLLKEFNLRRSQAGDDVQVEQIARAMGLSDDQITSICKMLVTTVNYSQIGRGKHRDLLDEHDHDVTALRHGACRDRTDTPEMCALQPMLEKLKQAHLTPFEEDVFLTSLPGCDYYGWQSDVASRHINPRTNKPYTRAGAAIALESAYIKLRRVVRQDPFDGYNVRKK